MGRPWSHLHRKAVFKIIVIEYNNLHEWQEFSLPRIARHFFETIHSGRRYTRAQLLRTPLPFSAQWLWTVAKQHYLNRYRRRCSRKSYSSSDHPILVDEMTPMSFGRFFRPGRRRKTTVIATIRGSRSY